MRYVVVLVPLVCGCSMPHGAAINSSAQDEPTSEATWQRVLDVPVLKLVGKFCDEVIYEDDEYRDCQLVTRKASHFLSGTPCGDHIRTADHRFEMDTLYVDGAQVPAPRPHVWRHEYDDVLFIEHAVGQDANCREYIPPAGTKVWAIGYPFGDDVGGDVHLDHREKIAVEGIVVDDRGMEPDVVPDDGSVGDGRFHPDLIHIELKGFVSGGMSGGPVVAEVDGALVAFATIVSAPEYTMEPASWLDRFRPSEGIWLRAILCRARDEAIENPGGL